MGSGVVASIFPPGPGCNDCGWPWLSTNGPFVYMMSGCPRPAEAALAAASDAAAASRALAAPGRFSPARSSSVKPCFRALASQ